MCLFSHLSVWMPVVPLFLCYLFIFVLMLHFLCQIKYWHRQVPEIKVVTAYALVDFHGNHFHDFISQENSNYVTLVETDANNIKPSQLHSFHPKGFFQWEDGKFLKTKQATWIFCFNRRASLFYLHVGSNLRHFASLTSSPWMLCAYKVASPHLSHNQYWPWPRGYWAAYRDGLQSSNFCRAQQQGCVIPEAPPLCTRGCCCQGKGCFAGAASPLGFFTLQLCRKKVQLHPSIQQINPKWLQLHSLTRSLMSSTRWASAVPVTAMPVYMGQRQGHHLALTSSRGSQGLSTNGPIQWGCHQHQAPCRLLGCHKLAWVWKHMGKVYINQTNSNKSIEATLLLLET